MPANPPIPIGDPEVLVIGGGPGGSCAATLLARQGRRVRLLEKEVFPRFHIGESLLPYNRPLFEELGIWPELSRAGFPKKYGAQFHLANGRKSRRFVFREGRFTKETEIVQVERSRFDHLLLRHAQGAGVEVREGWTVRRFSELGEGVEVEATDPAGQAHTLTARCLIDASGRANLTGNQQGLREVHPRHRKVAVFGHFTGVLRDEGEAEGDTVIVRFARSWFWLIPVSAGVTSVGLVLDQGELGRARGGPEGAFDQAVAASVVMRARMAQARLTGPLRTTADFSYFNRRLVGKRLLRVGDAAGFMDPIFSAGVYLAMWSGRLAAEAVGGALTSGGNWGARLRQYERRVNRSQQVYWRLVEQYYTTPFMELFLEPRPGLDLPAAVLAVLAGDLEPSWRVRWRLRMFYLLVWLQERRALVPRIESFGDLDEGETSGAAELAGPERRRAG